MSRRLRFLLLAAIVFAVEVLIATAFKHLSFIRGSLGDILVVVLLYALILGVRDFHRLRLGAAVFFFACLVELAQAMHLARWLGFRPGSVPAIVIGETAQFDDVVCYLIGTIAVVLLTRKW